MCVLGVCFFLLHFCSKRHHTTWKMVQLDNDRPIAGSTTVVEAITSQTNDSGTLHLAAEAPERPSVRWTDDVIDNEHMNKKKSKVCCIFHKNRPFGESSSDESSSSSGSDSDSDSDSGSRNNGHNHQDHCDHSKQRRRRRAKKLEREPSPNAYERQPKYNVNKEKSTQIDPVEQS